jgi:hypothetical protein
VKLDGEGAAHHKIFFLDDELTKLNKGTQAAKPERRDVNRKTSLHQNIEAEC